MTPAQRSDMRLAAVDLGAESGRVIVGTLDNGQLRMHTAHRFANRTVQHGTQWRWDLPALQAGILTGLSKAAAGGPLASVGIDTWGVDGTWIDAHGHAVTAARCYRDPRTVGWPERLERELGAGTLFRRTGTQPMVFNTVFQLAAARHSGEAPDATHRWLFMPDLLHHWLSGVAANEWTIASTSGLTMAGQCAWDHGLIDKLGLPSSWFGPLVRAGTVLGPMRSNLWDALGTGTAAPQVIATAGHDTASAFAAANPAPGSAVVSCGTWSLVGAITDHAITSDDAAAGKLSNEIAADGRVRLLTNVMGLWVVQQCRAAFADAGRSYDYAALTERAAAAASPAKTLDVDDQSFFAPSTASDPMPARIVAWYRARGLPVPGDDGAIIRSVLEGLAAAYARTCGHLAAVTGHAPHTLNVVGGGVKNRLLLELAQRACGIPVIAGPSEATAIGNLLVQAKALGLAVHAIADQD